MSQVEYIARVHEEEGSLWAEILDLPGCFASGESLDELREALEEAVMLYVDSRATVAPVEGRPSRRLSVGEMRVTVPA